MRRCTLPACEDPVCSPSWHPSEPSEPGGREESTEGRSFTGSEADRSSSKQVRSAHSGASWKSGGLSCSSVSRTFDECAAAVSRTFDFVEVEAVALRTFVKAAADAPSALAASASALERAPLVDELSCPLQAEHKSYLHERQNHTGALSSRVLSHTSHRQRDSSQ